MFLKYLDELDIVWLKVTIMMFFVGLLLGGILIYEYMKSHSCPTDEICIEDRGETYQFFVKISTQEKTRALKAAAILDIKIILSPDWEEEPDKLLLFIKRDRMHQFWDIYSQLEPNKNPPPFPGDNALRPVHPGLKI
jgi:hypothetical protein